MSAFSLKLIALICMIIDHVGVVFYDKSWMRCVGRIAFPIFAFFIAQGCKYTKDINKYVIRLFVCALISEAFFDLALEHGEINFFGSFNTIFTLTAGALCICFVIMAKEKILNKFAAFGIVLFILLLSEILGFDYGSLGTALIVLFYIAETKIKQIISLVCIVIVKYYTVLLGILSEVFNIDFLIKFRNYVFDYNIFLVIFMLVPTVFIYLYNGKQGIRTRKAKYFFYIFYPAHLFVIWLVDNFL